MTDCQILIYVLWTRTTSDAIAVVDSDMLRFHTINDVDTSKSPKCALSEAGTFSTTS